MSSVEEILVSVVIPTYKGKSSLKKAVDSALSQFPNKPEIIEVIIVDDHSPEGDFELAQEMAKTDPRIKVFQTKENGGSSVARNLGFEKAVGQWIAILDSDDWFEEGRLEHLINESVANHVHMACDNQIFFDKHANVKVATAFPDKGRKRIITLDEFLKSSNATLHFDYGMLKPVFRTDFIRNNNIQYYGAARMGEDYYFLFDYFAKGGKAVLLDKPYYGYLQPFGSISGKAQQVGRKHYKHQFQKMAHEHYFDLYRHQMSPSQIKEMERRGKEIDAILLFYEVKDALKQKKLGLLLKHLCKSNDAFWKMIAQRITSRIRNKLLGRPSYIVLD